MTNDPTGSSGPDPFTADVVEAIVGHMNADHAADTLVICQALAGLPDATAARLTGLDEHGIQIVAQVAGEERTAQVPWFQTPTDRPDIRHQIVHLFEAAQTADPDR